MMEKVISNALSPPISFFLLLLLLAATAWSNPVELDKNGALFIFGDSFLDSGNNNYINTTTLDQANFWPYGETFFNFPTGRFSDGRLISDFLAEYANLPLIPPFLQPGFHQYYVGVNFASAGAGALSETFHGSVIDLKEQVKNYKKVETWMKHNLGKAQVEEVVSRGIYLFSVGTNDYISPFLVANSTTLKSYSHSQYVALVIGNLTIAVKEIYRRGGRKFGFLNLPPVGCSPGLRIIKENENGECFEEVTLLVKLHNKALIKLLIALEKQLKGFKYSLFDLYTSLMEKLENPSAHGLKEGKEACCGIGRFRGVFSCGGRRRVKEFQVCENPNDYVFWDSYHFTDTVHQQIAHQMWTASSHRNNSSYTMRDLFHLQLPL